jgi:hypothetical protein
MYVPCIWHVPNIRIFRWGFPLMGWLEIEPHRPEPTTIDENSNLQIYTNLAPPQNVLPPEFWCAWKMYTFLPNEVYSGGCTILITIIIRRLCSLTGASPAGGHLSGRGNT